MPGAIWAYGGPGHFRAEGKIVTCAIRAIANGHFIRLSQTMPRLVQRWYYRAQLLPVQLGQPCMSGAQLNLLTSDLFRLLADRP
jgi:hypothetical protein